MKKYLLKDALEKGYAVGAFNFGTVEILKSIIKASEETSSPVIAQVSEGGINFIGEDYLKGIIAAARKNCSVPISFHLDHGKSLESVKKAIDVGCDSVMIDASMLSFEDNITVTKNVVDYAHSKGVFVEAELGSLAGVEEDVNVSDKDSCYTDPSQAKEFVERTGVDSLAVAIGTKHGAYKFGGDAKLRFDILENIQKEIPNVPLVLHGASGVDSKTVDKLLQNNTYVTLRLWVDNIFQMQMIELINNYYNCDIDLTKKSFQINKYLYVKQFHEFIWPDLNNDYYEETGTCYALRDHIGILVDGTVIPCCLDTEGTITLGNIYQDNLNDILNDEIVISMLKGFQQNKKCEELCKHCSFIK